MQNDFGAAKQPNPFNPGSPVDPNDFVGRVAELGNFRQKLLQTASGSLASMAVAGGYGVGKTSFLHKCKVVAEENNALAVYFSLNEIDSLSKESLAKTLVQRIQDKVREEVILRRISDSILKTLSRVRVKTSGGVEISLGESQDSLTLNSALSAAWNTLRASRTAIVFLIDEARVLEKNRAELFLYLRAVLEQLQIERVPVMIVPAGKLSISGPSGTGFSPLVRTFPQVVLENFSQTECRLFIDRKLGQTDFRITDDAFKRVYEVTEGHPFVLTAYLNSAYSKLSENDFELTQAHLKAVDLDFVKTVLSPFFSRFYDHSGKLSKNILSKIAASQKNEASLSELCDYLKKENNELSPHLAKLVQDGAILRIDRGRYKLFHHLLGEYVRFKEQSN